MLFLIDRWTLFNVLLFPSIIQKMIFYLEEDLKFLLNIICLGRKVQTKKLKTKGKESILFSDNWKYSASDLQNHFFFFLILGLIQNKKKLPIRAYLIWLFHIEQILNCTGELMHRLSPSGDYKVWFILDPVMTD